MRRKVLGTLLVGTLLVVWGCAASQHKMAQAGPSELTGVSVWAWMQEHSYQSWSMWPGESAMYEGREPHGMLLTTYVNGPASHAAQEKTRPMPEGTVIVKENYKPTKELAAITVMVKSQDYNPDGGDWWWAKYGPDGKTLKEGKVAGCLGCHGMEKANDYILTDMDHKHDKHQ
jgi:hypothetical protein